MSHGSVYEECTEKVFFQEYQLVSFNDDKTG